MFKLFCSQFLVIAVAGTYTNSEIGGKVRLKEL